MSRKRAVEGADLPKSAAPLSQGIEAGGFVFVSGQVPRDPATGKIPEGIHAQTRLVLQNVELVLRAAGCSLADVVKVTAHLSDLALRDSFNEVYRQVMPQPYPTRTTAGSELGGVLVEIDAIAIKAG